jgi:glycosyltransferase involved in cell wall biosynthesis
MSLKIITIVPRLPPSIDGVGDYALQLAQVLRRQHQIETEFIVCDPSWQGTVPFPVQVLTADAATELFDRLCRSSASIVLFQLSGYGYHKWSLYGWIVDALQRWQRQYGNQVKLVTMFHELYKPMGWRPWRHRFWFGPEQKALIKRLSRSSDGVLTNCAAYAIELVQLSGGRHSAIPVLPVFSNIPVPEWLPRLADRPRRLVVFGLDGTRARVYNQAIDALNEFCLQFGIESVVDVGAPTGLDLAARLAVPVVAMGYQSPEAVSELLRQAIAGWTLYDANLLSKSGIFAAYCAHGLVPIVTSPIPLAPGFGEDEVPPYLPINAPHQVDGRWSDPALQLLADRANYWYQSHPLDRQAQVFSQMLQELVAVELRVGCHTG